MTLSWQGESSSALNRLCSGVMPTLSLPSVGKAALVVWAQAAPQAGASLWAEGGQDPQEAVKEEQGWSQGTAGAPSSMPWICPAPLGNTSETVGIIQERSQGLPAGGA